MRWKVVAAGRAQALDVFGAYATLDLLCVSTLSQHNTKGGYLVTHRLDAKLHIYNLHYYIHLPLLLYYISLILIMAIFLPLATHVRPIID